MSRIRTALAVGTMLIAGVVRAQEVRGTVRDSVSGFPIGGAVIAAVDSTGMAVARAITSELGRFRIAQAGPARRLIVTRIGFRPRDIAIARDAPDATDVDITMTSIPTLLQQVQVTATTGACPARADAGRAAGLFAQARAGLLSTVVAREANPATVTRLAFERVMDANGDRIVSQRVRMENADRASVSFNAVRTSVEFARKGFASDTGAQRTYFGPDADILLDDAFARAYCFRIDPAPTSRPNQVGLGFAPSGRQNGRVDIDGTIWIDTVRRALSDVDFRYLGLDDLSAGFGSGGTVSFREVTGGITLIDRWTLRLVGAVDSTVGDPSNIAVSRRYLVREIGGELAHVAWPDGRTWTAPLGTLRLVAHGAGGTPVAGAVIALAGTDYRGTSDASGAVEIAALVPGPYTATVVEPRLATLGLSLPTGLSFNAARDSIITQPLAIPTAEAFVAEACRATGRVEPDAAWIIARVGTPDGRPVGGARWELAKGGAGGWIPVSQGGATGSSGLLQFCRGLRVGETVQLQAWRGKEPRAVATRKLAGQLTVADLRLPTAGSVRAGSQVVVDVVGTVTDSATGAPVPEAFVSLVGVSAMGITDSAGRFSLTGVPRGDYTAEVRTVALDSLGVVGRTSVGVGTTPLALHPPSRVQLISAMCGVDPDVVARAAGLGVVLGRVRVDGDTALPNTRIVAEWTEGTGAASRARWLRAYVDAAGTYRLCGVPSGVPLVLRTQVPSESRVAAQPVTAEVAASRAFSRADITLARGVTVGGAFAGSVVADSTETPIPDAEVAFPDLNRSVLTNADGAFRISDIPPGTHRVVVRRVGFGPLTAELSFAANETIDHRVVLGVATNTLKPVEVSGTAAPNEQFEANRKLGLGKFLTRAELQASSGRKLSDVMATVANMGSVTQAGSLHGWVVGKRVPPRLPPRGMSTSGGNCGTAPIAGPPGGTAPCVFTPDDLREQGYYCPQPGEEIKGITCACYGQVYLDGKLMNRGRPTEPFDINAVPPEQLDGVEWYASPSQTPSQYSSLDSPCGVLVIWTRTRGHFH